MKFQKTELEYHHCRSKHKVENFQVDSPRTCPNFPVNSDKENGLIFKVSRRKQIKHFLNMDNLEVSTTFKP